ncbi:MAG: hypothetical protein V4507_06025 [Verrucomicrobiota bacterium]
MMTKQLRLWFTRIALFILAWGGIVQPTLQAQSISLPVLAQSAMPSGSDAEAKFTNLYLNLKRFAGVLLLIGLVIGAIMWFMGKTSVAIGVISGGLILYGGAYILALLRDSL